MGDLTRIQWTDHTFNPWIGCTKVSPGCAHCYAEALDRRWGRARWGKGAARGRTSETYWKQPLRWNAKAEAAQTPARVFCGSLCDVFDEEAPAGALRELLELIGRTPWLAWQLLTKRPERIRKQWPANWRASPPENLWLGTTVEDQEHAAKRIPHLLETPARVHFLSCEPLLGPVDLRRLEVVRPTPPHGPGVYLDALTGLFAGPDDRGPQVDWVIVGGESGPAARPFDLGWARSIRAQCGSANVPCFVKQLGADPMVGAKAEHVDREFDVPGGHVRFALTQIESETHLTLRDHKGGDPAEWPPDLRVREFPGGVL